MRNIKNFFIAFFVSLIVFALIGWFIYGKVFPKPDPVDETKQASSEVETLDLSEFEPGGETDREDTENGDNPDGEPVILNTLVCFYDELTERADSIIMVNIKSIPGDEEDTFSICSIPSYLKVDVEGDTVFLGDIVSRDFDVKEEKKIELFLKEITALTGIEIDHYAFLKPEHFIKVINGLGGIEYDVPMNMKYTDVNGDVLVDLKKGDKQMLTGEQAYQLLRFRSYPSSFDSNNGDGDMSRRNIQREFLNRLCDTFLNEANRGNVLAQAKNIIPMISDTNVTLDAVEKYLDLFFNYDAYIQNTVDFPVQSNKTEYITSDTGEKIAVYIPDTGTQTQDMFKTYRKTAVTEE